MTDLGLAGKRVIVTGAAGGLGRAFALAFAKAGAQVMACDVNLAGCKETAALTGGFAAAVDVTNTASCRALADLAQAQLGGVDVLVNNAAMYGGLERRNFEDLDEDVWDKVMAVNVKGTMLGTQLAARHMASHGGGAVINISSISGVRPGFGFFSYRASKAAVINFSQSAASELGAHLIRVNCICPGNIPTEMGTYAHTPGMSEARAARIGEAIRDARMDWQPLKRQGSPRDIAEAVMFLASDRSAQVTGQVLSVDGGSAATDSRSQIADIMAARARAEAEAD